MEANLDTQFAFGLTFPTPGTFYSTAGRPPFIPDIGTTTDTNEPYLIVSIFIRTSRRMTDFSCDSGLSLFSLRNIPLNPFRLAMVMTSKLV